MATSGATITKPCCSRNGANRYYLKIVWNSTQEATNNRSKISVKCYIGSYGNGYAINSSVKKSGSLKVNGTTYSFTSLTSISSGGSRLIYSNDSIYITHDSSGNAQLSIQLTFNPAVTISGSNFGSTSTDSKTYTLPQTLQASTFGSTAGWKCPNNKTITINRKSTSVKHTVKIFINNSSTAFKTWTKTSSTSFSTSFTDSENVSIIDVLKNNSWKVPVKMTLETYSGDEKIGSTATIEDYITIYSKSSTTLTTSLNIGGTVSGKITENHSSYRHSVDLLQNNGSTLIKNAITYTSDTLSWSVTPTASDMYKLCPNSNTYVAKLRLRTYYKTTGTQVGADVLYNVTFKVTGSNPTFAPTLSYVDTNTTTYNLLGASGLTLVQNKSNLQVTVTGNATANNSATMKSITCAIANKTTQTKNYSASATSYTFNMGTVNSSSNQVCTITAIDSRGNKTAKTITVKFIPYTPPKISASVARANQFSTTVNVIMKGSIAPLNISGTRKNSVSLVQYTYNTNGGTQGNTTSGGTPTYSGGNFTCATEQFTLAETSISTVIITVKDALGTQVTANYDVSTGSPLMYIDADKGNIAFNCLPDMSKEANMKLGVNVELPPNQYWVSTTSTNEPSYGLDANNSDIIGLNAMVFGDACNYKNHEGIFFPDSGAEFVDGYGTIYFDQCSRLYMRDGQLWVGTSKVTNGYGQILNPCCVGNANMMSSLWSGQYYMTGSQTITPSKDLKACPTGWVLVWSDYDSDTTTANDGDWCFTYIPKQLAGTINANGGVLCQVSGGLTATVHYNYTKRVYITNTTIKGHDQNSSGDNGTRDIVLRYVFMY